MTTENALSFGFRLVFGKFRFYLGDLVWNELGEKGRPKNLLAKATCIFEAPRQRVFGRGGGDGRDSPARRIVNSRRGAAIRRRSTRRTPGLATCGSCNFREQDREAGRGNNQPQ